MFKSTRELSEKIEWIMQMLKEINTKINEGTARIMKVEAEFKNIQINEVERQVVRIIENIGKIKEITSEAEKLKEVIDKVISSNIQVQEESIKKINELQEITKKISEEIIQVKNKMDTSINTIMEKIGNIEGINQEAIKSIISIKDLEVTALKNISTSTMIQNKINELEANIQKLLEDYKAAIENITTAKIEANKLMEKAEIQNKEIKKRLEELSYYEEKLNKKEEELNERERTLTKLINTIIEKIKEYEDIMKLTNSRIAYLKILEDKERELEEKIRELRDEKEKLEKEINVLIKRKNYLEEEVYKLNEEKRDLEKVLMVKV